MVKSRLGILYPEQVLGGWRDINRGFSTTADIHKIVMADFLTLRLCLK